MAFLALLMRALEVVSFCMVMSLLYWCIQLVKVVLCHWVRVLISLILSPTLDCSTLSKSLPAAMVYGY